MIPVKPAPEPQSFDKNVRIPGRKFLSDLCVPKQRNPGVLIPWNDARYWKRCANKLEKSYNHICCYVGMRINGNIDDERRSVEHFIPKSVEPWLAYEWSNYRLACRKANTDRGTKTVIDPFLVGPDDFRIDLFSCELFPNSELSPAERELIQKTIDSIGLNNSYWKANRRTYYERYQDLIKNCPVEEANKYLKKNAPIILAELQRPVKPIYIEED